ncbi:hypothetical protein N7510_010548 [Penicillium lagena]|uniref:uncharacterized protein n=1 Tax=Penicillium lagena TaxID=94218 RepID=UPI002540D756|nr:uncharacterized protein N7510_010548 [Penicillium lagena]KAJ5601014.1 hypothetical protein N7510_010548 [Penicillium lagena]
MHKPSLAQIVYNATFPRPLTSDPGSFAAHITRNLVPEVRLETSIFYGSLDCIEAQYPGLDYSYGPHRMRLGRFTWHHELFRVFDELGLTEAEILSLCRWEGTRWARERYEKEEGISVRDTTAHSIRPATPPPSPSVEVHFEDFCGPEEELDYNIDTRSDHTVRASQRNSTEFLEHKGEDHEVEEEDYSDEEMESCGVALNSRLLAAMAARDQGANVPLDEDWEQWLKEVGDGERGYSEMFHAIRAGQPLNFLSSLRHREGTRIATSATSFFESIPLSTVNILASSAALPSSSNPASGTAR